MATERLTATLQQIRSLVDEAIRELEGTERGVKTAAVRGRKQPTEVSEFSFDTNVLAFMTKHARHLSGHQKFTLLLGRLTKGNVSQKISSSEVEKHWNKMKVILGGKYNSAYANRAKANGWVDTPQHGVFTLSRSWKAALTDSND